MHQEEVNDCKRQIIHIKKKSCNKNTLDFCQTLHLSLRAPDYELYLFISRRIPKRLKAANKRSQRFLHPCLRSQLKKLQARKEMESLELRRCLVPLKGPLLFLLSAVATLKSWLGACFRRMSMARHGRLVPDTARPCTDSVTSGFPVTQPSKARGKRRKEGDGRETNTLGS